MARSNWMFDFKVYQNKLSVFSIQMTEDLLEQPIHFLKQNKPKLNFNFVFPLTYPGTESTNTYPPSLEGTSHIEWLGPLPSAKRETTLPP